ncbi:sodium/proton-translocating pyrophosphatase, partial [Vibrio parahaemolyticus]|nr:sodium/proton-translocating pyrophosphatase [Vibrio parahaemolyticus]
MNIALIAAPIAGVVALLFAFYKATYVNKQNPGNKRMEEISSYIHEGAMAFLSSQYRYLAVFILVLFIVLGILISWKTSITFLFGALFSILAGYFGMNVATKANVRTSNAAMESGINEALKIAFSGGTVMGMCV